MIRPRLLLSALLGALLLWPAWLPADNVSPGQLRELRERIRGLEQQQQKDLRQRDRLAADLREREAAIARLDREQTTLQQRQREAAQRLDQLKTRQRSMAAEQATQVEWIARTVRLLYGHGKEPTTKLLLSQQQPDQVARLLRYHDYMQRARSERLSTLKTELEALIKVSLEVADAREQLGVREAEVSAQQRRLGEARQQRAAALTALNAQVTEQGQRLGALRADESRLDALLQQMNRVIADIPAQPSGAPFGQLAGKLPFPLEGRTRVNFGTVRSGSLRWNGMILEATPGTPVRAIHTGRVVYSDWLRGYGFMLIVDHGNGYLSLYGHNQTLLREVGDWVSAGDVLARSGDSGGAGDAGLYFEIRRQGKPVNPNGWVNRRVTLPPLN